MATIAWKEPASEVFAYQNTNTVGGHTTSMNIGTRKKWIHREMRKEFWDMGSPLEDSENPTNIIGGVFFHFFSGFHNFCFMPSSPFGARQMNFLVKQFFSKGEGKGEIRFQEVCFLDSQMDWEQALIKAPSLPRPWFELSRISVEDRIEFVRDFWLDRLPYSPTSYPEIVNFFQRLDDIGIVLHRQSQEELFSVEMVYSLKDDSCFFRGLPPASDEEWDQLRSELQIQLPLDFQAFSRIHNGFGKLSELGLLRLEDLFEERRAMIDSLLTSESVLRSGEKLVDPQSLIPFYESFGLASYQCFYSDWYPGFDMGNIYLSGIDYTISDITDSKAWAEHLAFASFLDWLAYYLDGADLSI